MHTALRYAAGGFAEAKGKYRGSIVESFAVVPIGCRIAQGLNDKARIAGINGSFRRGGSGNALDVCMYLWMHTACACVCTLRMYVRHYVLSANRAGRRAAVAASSHHCSIRWY